MDQLEDTLQNEINTKNIGTNIETVYFNKGL